MKTFFFHDFIFNECYIVKSNHCACSQLHKRSSLYYACLIRSIFTLSMLISLCLVYNILRKYILVYSCNCDIGIKTLCLRMCYTYFVFVNIFCSQIVSNTCIISWIEIFRTFDWHMNYLKGMNFLLQKNKNDELSRIAGELSIQGDQNDAEDDLLNLMDSAWWEKYCIMGKMEWPAGPDLCNIFVSVIFLFVVHCHEFRMKARLFLGNIWSQNLLLFIIINQSPSVWIQLNCWDFPLQMS